MSHLVLVPRISEKAIGLADRGVYVFEVPVASNKIEVAKAIEKEYGVDVTGVNILIQKGKQTSRRYGKHAGRRADVKKAIVSLKKGQSIALFEEGGK